MFFDTVYSALHAILIRYTVHCLHFLIRYTVHCVQFLIWYTVLCLQFLIGHTVHCLQFLILCRVHCLQFLIRYTVHCLHFLIQYTVHCLPFSLNCVRNSSLSTFLSLFFQLRILCYKMKFAECSVCIGTLHHKPAVSCTFL